jgi:hypothetical protein
MESEVEIVHVGRTAFAISAEPGRGLTFRQLHWPTQSIEAEIVLPYPRRGLGGAVLSISPREKFAAAVVYSGQSETGYELFALAPSLKHIASFPYVGAEWDLTPMQFSADERLVAVAIEENGFWWVDRDDEADWETAASGGRVEWATLLIHPLDDPQPRVYPLVVDVPAGWFPHEGTWPGSLQFESERSLSLELPWGGRFIFDLPPVPAPIVVPPPHL